MRMTLLKRRIAEWLAPLVIKPCAFTGKPCAWSTVYRPRRGYCQLPERVQERVVYIPLTMSPERFLQALLPGMHAIGSSDLGALFSFVFLWEYVETALMKTREPLLPSEIWSRVRTRMRFEEHQKVRIGSSREELERWSRANEEVSSMLNELEACDRDAHYLVKRVLEGREMTYGIAAVGMLMLAWWFRQNLFTGENWDESLRWKVKSMQALNELMQTVLESITGKYPQFANMSDGVAGVLGLK